jgi:crotonobetainyl-CoA:carnitine CoA-transferase CaiB-like acyl-CoA transferase
MLTYPATWYLMEGLEPQRTANSAHPSVVPFQNFATADGWIVVGCAKEKFWTRLTACLGRDDLAADERFATFARRRAHAQELLPVLEGIFVSAPTEHWIDLLTEAGVPTAPINSIPEALADPQAVARGAVVETDHPRFGVVRQPAGAVRVGDEEIPHRRAPLRHEDGPFVLSQLLGYGPDQIAALEREGAFGALPQTERTTT